MAGNQHQQPDTPCGRKQRAVKEHRDMADPVPQKAGNDAGHELQQADGGAVPAHTARPQFVRDEVCCERLANRAEGAPPFATAA